MTIHEFGRKQSPVLVMMHPLAVRWDVFDRVIPELQQHFRLIIPAMPGFDPDLPEDDYTSVEQIAEETADWLTRHGLRHVCCLYGCSMGGGVVLRMLADQIIATDCAVIDAGMTPYTLPQPLPVLIGVRDFLMMELGKHMSVHALRSMFDPDQYSDEDLLYAKEVMSQMSIRTIWRGFYSCNNYSMPKDPLHPDCAVQYWYGENEKRQRKWDIDWIRRMLPKAELIEHPGQGHAEFFTLYPDEFCTALMQFCSLHSEWNHGS